MSVLTYSREVLAIASIVGLVAGPLGAGTVSAQPAHVQRQDPALGAEIRKINAYTALMNRTLAVAESWRRYASWVDMRIGPTGRERFISYGLYRLADVSRELAAARQAMADPPSRPELDQAVGRYILAYETLAPLINRAERYYERQDYRADGLAEGQELHRQMVPAAEAYHAAREGLERQMRQVRADLDRRELADLEAREGRLVRWQLRDTIVRARAVIDVLSAAGQQPVDLAALDEAIAGYVAAIREMERYSVRNPEGLSSFEGQAGAWLGRLRAFREALGRADGDLRRVAHDATWLLETYNSLVSLARTSMPIPTIGR